LAIQLSHACREEKALAGLVGEQIYQAGSMPSNRLSASRASPRPARRTSAGSIAAAGVADRSIECQGLVIERYGGPEVLHWERLSAPPPGPGELRIRHTAIGLNYIDVYARTGYYPLVDPPGVIRDGAAGVWSISARRSMASWRRDRVAYAATRPGPMPSTGR